MDILLTDFHSHAFPEKIAAQAIVDKHGPDRGLIDPLDTGDVDREKICFRNAQVLRKLEF